MLYIKNTFFLSTWTFHGIMLEETLGISICSLSPSTLASYGCSFSKCWLVLQVCCDWSRPSSPDCPIVFSVLLLCLLLGTTHAHIMITFPWTISAGPLQISMLPNLPRSWRALLRILGDSVGTCQTHVLEKEWNLTFKPSVSTSIHPPHSPFFLFCPSLMTSHLRVFFPFLNDQPHRFPCRAFALAVFVGNSFPFNLFFLTFVNYFLWYSFVGIGSLPSPPFSPSHPLNYLHYYLNIIL